ncbi:MAG: DUF397 domain-containing protein [Pseudonocardiaceae bacterium]|jgi:hypothetical protein|nr:DUF397 domain-containing protein [Pseudonocardiaceae bacterium]
MPRIVGEWFLPRRSDNNVNCVQTKFTGDTVSVRNNRRPEAGTAVFDHDEWAVFIASVKDGDYDV